MRVDRALVWHNVGTLTRKEYDSDSQVMRIVRSFSTSVPAGSQGACFSLGERFTESRSVKLEQSSGAMLVHVSV